MFDALLLRYPWAAWFLTGVIGTALKYFIKALLGRIADFGIMQFDLTADALIRAFRKPELKEQAHELYAKSSKKVYNESEKQVIREQYMDHLRSLTELRRSTTNTER